MTPKRDLTTDILRLRSLIAAEQFELLLARSALPTERLSAKSSQLQASLALRRMQLAYARHLVALGKAGFNPAQPRVPAGHPEGGQWTREGGAADAGPYRDVVRDTSGRQPWESYANLYRADGSLAEQAVVNRDGSAIRAQFASSEAAGWDERYAVRTADGDVTTFQNAGPVQTILDSEGRPVSQTLWTSDGPEAQAFVQPAYFEAVPHPAAKAVGAALALYTWMSSRNTAESTAVFGFRADAYSRGASADDAAIWAGRLTREEVDDACPRHAEVQSIANRAAEVIDRGAFRSAAEYGTAVHMWIRREINGPDSTPASEPRDPNFRAELSLLKSDIEDYGVAGTRRIDVYENPESGTVCIYDIKTGRSGLTPARMLELASTVQYYYPGTQRIIVTEVRPRR